MRSSETLMELKEIPFVPPLVDLADLKENGKLLADKQIKQLKKTGLLHEYRNEKHELKQQMAELGNMPYSLIYIPQKDHPHFYAVYKGRKHHKLLGEGSFGLVKLAQELETGEWIALKNVTVSETYDDLVSDMEAIEKEKWGLNQLNMLLAPPYQRIKTKDGGIILQYEFLIKLAHGIDLGRLHLAMPILYWIDVSLDILRAIKKAHDHDIVHRDIKPDNLLYDATTRTLSLVDFGFAEKMNAKGLYIAAHAAGTAGYMPSEVYNNYRYSRKSDIYSAGVVLRDLLLRERSSYTETEFEIMEQLSLHISEMLHPKPARRPDIQTSIEFLLHLRSNLLHSTALPLRITYLDAHDYYAADVEEKKRLRIALAGTQEIWLIDKRGREEENYVTIKRELEAADFIVSAQVLQYHNSSDRANILLRYKNKREMSDIYIYECKAFTCHHHLQLYTIGTNLLNHEEKDKLIASLQRDAEDNGSALLLNSLISQEEQEAVIHQLKTVLLKNKSKRLIDARKTMIQETIQTIQSYYDHHELTYEIMRVVLYQLQEQLHSKKKVAHFLQSNGLFRNKHQKAVDKATKVFEKGRLLGL